LIEGWLWSIWNKRKISFSVLWKLGLRAIWVLIK
jgi:hypothetical protein